MVHTINQQLPLVALCEVLPSECALFSTVYLLLHEIAHLWSHTKKNLYGQYTAIPRYELTLIILEKEKCLVSL